VAPQISSFADALREYDMASPELPLIPTLPLDPAAITTLSGVPVPPGGPPAKLAVATPNVAIAVTAKSKFLIAFPLTKLLLTITSSGKKIVHRY
jgi:hypothetical protein